jgi:carbamoyltransferase
MDLAHSMQMRFEDICFHMLNVLHERVPSARLAMAGGCALNSVANGKIFDKTPFTTTWIQPAAGDEGLALGAALYAYHHVLGRPREYVMRDAYLGPEYDER